MSTPLEQAQSAARGARRRAERASSQGIGVDAAPAPPVEHFLSIHEQEQDRLREEREAEEKQEQEAHEARVAAAEKAAETRKKNEADAEKGGSK